MIHATTWINLQGSKLNKLEAIPKGSMLYDSTYITFLKRQFKHAEQMSCSLVLRRKRKHGGGRGHKMAT